MAKHHFRVAESLNLTTSLCLTYTLIVSILRLWVRRGKYALDDAVILAATLLALCQFAASYVALHFGAGQPLSIVPTTRHQALDLASFAGIIICTVGLYLSKCAVVAFMMRLTRTRSHLMLYNICVGLISAVGIASVLLITVAWPNYQNSYWQFLSPTGVCTAQEWRWDVFTALDVATEVLLFALPAHLLWSPHMSRSKKATVLIAFWLRIPTIAISISRAVYLQSLCRPDVDVSIAAAVVLMYCSGQVAYAIATNTFATLKPFTEDFNSGFGHGFARRSDGYDSYALSKISNTAEKGASKSGNIQVASPKGTVTSNTCRGPQTTKFEPTMNSRIDALTFFRDENENPSMCITSPSNLHDHSSQPQTTWRGSSQPLTSDSIDTNDNLGVSETGSYAHHQEHEDDIPILRDSTSVKYFC